MAAAIDLPLEITTLPSLPAKYSKRPTPLSRLTSGYYDLFGSLPSAHSSSSHGELSITKGYLEHVEDEWDLDLDLDWGDEDDDEELDWANLTKASHVLHAK